MLRTKLQHLVQSQLLFQRNFIIKWQKTASINNFTKSDFRNKFSFLVCFAIICFVWRAFFSRFNFIAKKVFSMVFHFVLGLCFVYQFTFQCCHLKIETITVQILVKHQSFWFQREIISKERERKRKRKIQFRYLWTFPLQQNKLFIQFFMYRKFSWRWLWCWCDERKMHSTINCFSFCSLFFVNALVRNNSTVSWTNFASRSFDAFENATLNTND